MKTLILSLVVVSQFFATQALACSSFAGAGIMAKNFDWVQGHGHIHVNQRNVAKRALVRPPENGHLWVSKFGSVTFNQFGRDLPMGGINEKGLAVEILWLDSAKFPAQDRQDAINEAQWIQFQLDTSATVAEMIRNAGRVRLSKRFASIHYFACDATGACAVFEPLDGKLRIYRGDDARSQVLTNSEYARSKAFLAQHEGFGGGKAIPMDSYASLDRFVRLNALKKGMERLPSFAEKSARAFELLLSVQHDFTTAWSIVYDLQDRKLVFKARDVDARLIKEVRLRDFDFSCRAERLMFDLAGNFEGNIRARFVPYSYELNHASVARAAKLVKDATPAEIEAVARFPESTKCIEK